MPTVALHISTRRVHQLVDMTQIDYKAPLTIKLPSPEWINTKFKAGLDNTKLYRSDVPFVDLSGKWIIITGSNNGIGREAALYFAHCGANIILACRTPPPHEIHPNQVVEECKSIASQAGHKSTQVEWWEIDMGKLSTVDAFAERWLATGRQLDILCNNAGMGTNPGGVSGNLKTVDGNEFVHQVNFSSHVLLTLRLLPSLAKAPEPRIVCTTSNTTYKGTYDFTNWDGTGCFGMQLYCNNKLYYQIWLSDLQDKLKASKKYKHITINGVHPGFVNSGIWSFNTGSGIMGVVVAIAQVLIKIRAWWKAITPEQGAYCITNAATSVAGGPDPETQGVGQKGGLGGGKFFNRIWETENMPHCKDPEARRRVWAKLDEELHLSEKGLLTEFN